jgi:hypothetical protein
MASGREYAVGVTVVPVSAPREFAEPDRFWDPETLPEMLPRGRTAVENARLLEQITAAEAMLAGLRVRAVVEMAAARPDSADRRPGAAAGEEIAGPGRLEGVSEFFADELATVLRSSRTAASVLTDRCAALTEKLPATLAALDGGTLARLEGPRRRSVGDCPGGGGGAARCDGAVDPAADRRGAPGADRPGRGGLGSAPEGRRARLRRDGAPAGGRGQ